MNKLAVYSTVVATSAFLGFIEDENMDFTQSMFDKVNLPVDREKWDDVATYFNPIAMGATAGVIAKKNYDKDGSNITGQAFLAGVASAGAFLVGRFFSKSFKDNPDQTSMLIQNIGDKSIDLYTQAQPLVDKIMATTADIGMQVMELAQQYI